MLPYQHLLYLKSLLTGHPSLEQYGARGLSHSGLGNEEGYDPETAGMNNDSQLIISEYILGSYEKQSNRCTSHGPSPCHTSSSMG